MIFDDWIPASRSEHRVLNAKLDEVLRQLDRLMSSAHRQEEALVAVQDEINQMAAQAAASADRINTAVANVQADFDRFEQEHDVDLTPLRDSLGQVGSATEGLQALADARPEPVVPGQDEVPAPEVPAEPVPAEPEAPVEVPVEGGGETPADTDRTV